MPNALKLYWWNGTPNFGDRLSQDVVAHVAGRPVVWAAPGECDLFAVGSLMTFVRRSHAVPRPSGAKPWVWGTGLVGPVRVDFVPNVRFAAVRGPLTQGLLDLPNLPYGDPALLLPDLFANLPPRSDRIGLVLHHSQKPDAALAAVMAADARIILIDVTDPDHRSVIAAIASCHHVFSSSLHGLIVADAFGVPNTWLDPSGIHTSATFKFYDYALSVARPLPRPISTAVVAARLSDLPDTLPYAAGVAAARTAIRAAFPVELRA
jgi:pyruvyltransferase